MIHVDYKAVGGPYTNLLKEKVKTVSRFRNLSLNSGNSSSSTYKVACTGTQGDPLTLEKLSEILLHKDITFIIGDSAGLSEDTLSKSDIVVCVGYYSMSHQLQAATLMEEIEQCVSSYVEPKVEIKEETPKNISENSEKENPLDDFEEENTNLPEITDEEEESKIGTHTVVGSIRKINDRTILNFIEECERNGTPVDNITEFCKRMEDGTSQTELVAKWLEIGGTIAEPVKKPISSKPEIVEEEISEKKKRGRPRKNIEKIFDLEQEQIIPENTPEVIVQAVEKKKRGRPAGVKNKTITISKKAEEKPKENDNSGEKKKRGRPAGVKNKPKITQESQSEVIPEPNISHSLKLETETIDQSELEMHKIAYYVPQKLISDIESVCNMFNITRSYFCSESLISFLNKPSKLTPISSEEPKKFFVDNINLELWNSVSRYISENNLCGITDVMSVALKNYIDELNN